MKERTVCNQGASHTPTKSSLQKFLDHLDMSRTTSLQPTAPPFPQEEIATLLPSIAQQGGHTNPPHPDQEAPTATAPQHRGPTAPLNPSKTTLLPLATIIPVFLNV